MQKAVRQGILMGLVAPLTFAVGVILWIYRYTGRVPFPTRRTQEGELAIGLVEPDEVPRYWAHWREELAPILGAAQELFGRVRAQVQANCPFCESRSAGQGPSD